MLSCSFRKLSISGPVSRRLPIVTRSTLRSRWTVAAAATATAGSGNQSQNMLYYDPFLHYNQRPKRAFISSAYLRDVIFQRPNPLLTLLQTTPKKDGEEGEGNNTTIIPLGDDQPKVEIDLDRIPKLSNIEPFHGQTALQQVMETYKTELSTLQQNLQDGGGKDDEWFWNEWNRIVDPVLGLGRIFMFMSAAKETPKEQWKKLLKLYQEKRLKIDKDAMWIHSTMIQSSPTTTMTAQQQALAAKTMTRHLEESSPILLQNTKEENDQETVQERYHKLQTALTDVKKSFLEDYTSGTVDKQTIGLMYSVIGLLTDRAKLLGYPNYGTQILKEHGRMASRDEMEQLLQSVIESLAPHVQALAKEQSQNEAKNLGALSKYLKASDDTLIKAGPPKPLPQHVLDERSQIRLEKYVTLDGAMEFLSHLLKSVFGVDLVRDEASVDAWDKEVRLYHVYDIATSKHVGSFFIDPFERSGKMEQPCVAPIHVRNNSQVPVCAMLLQIEVPTWDTDPAMLRYEDLAHLFHEMGHVLQVLLSSHPYGSLSGSQSMPRDALEILPTFMEKWLLDKNTLFGLIAASKTKIDFTQDSIDAFYRVLERQRVAELSRQVYLGKLEWTLLASEFDLRGKETIMQLQHRLAKELTPHEVPGKGDFSTLVNVLAHNVSEDAFGFCSYIWADAVSSRIFAQIKQDYEQDASQLSKHSESSRRLLLHPGAAVPMDEIRTEWGLGPAVSSDAMLQLYGLKK